MARELKRICGDDYLPRPFDLDASANIQPQQRSTHNATTQNNPHQQSVTNTFQTLPAYPPGIQPNRNLNLNIPLQVPVSTVWQPYPHHQQNYLSTGFPMNNWNHLCNPGAQESGASYL